MIERRIPFNLKIELYVQYVVNCHSRNLKSFCVKKSDKNNISKKLIYRIL